jgi:hypothetical protein
MPDFDFRSADYKFTLAGEGVSVDAETGSVSIPAETLFGGVEVNVTATNTEGTMTSVFKVAVTPSGVAAPVAANGLADVTAAQGTGPVFVDAAADFTGADLVYSIKGAGAAIDAATGRVTIATATLVSGETVTVTAENSAGAATSAFLVTVAATVLPPKAIGILPDVAFLQRDGVRTVSAQAGFEGADLAWSLETAPVGVMINAGSGLVSIPTTTAIAGAQITVRATNAGGTATQSFGVSVRSTVTVFDKPESLADIGFIAESQPPEWSFEDAGHARLVPFSSGRLHGDWNKATGDGVYRCLVRWNPVEGHEELARPFCFSARVTKEGKTFNGIRLSPYMATSTATGLELREYKGLSTASRGLGAKLVPWEWGVWYWVELEVSGTSLRARLYPENADAPDWQVTAQTTHTGAGAFGPGGFPRNRVSPEIDIRRLEYLPLNEAESLTPPIAAAQDWSLNQVTEQ